MAELTQERINEIRASYRLQMAQFEGAIAALDQLEAELYPKDSMTLDELKQGLGAQSVEIVENAN